MPGAVRGTCESVGFSVFVETTTVQQTGSPVAMEVMIMAASNAVSPTCHCHSYEEITCDSAGDGLYDEHIDELQTYCQQIVSGSETECPHKCFQPFEVLHLHYLQCGLRPKHDLYKQIENTHKCHLAAKAPFGTQCDVV